MDCALGKMMDNITHHLLKVLKLGFWEAGVILYFWVWVGCKPVGSGDSS